MLPLSGREEVEAAAQKSMEAWSSMGLLSVLLCLSASLVCFLGERFETLVLRLFLCTFAVDASFSFSSG
jgi:hypothetical protein